VTLSGLV